MHIRKRVLGYGTPLLVLPAMFCAGAALAQQWTELLPTGALPGPRADATAVYNPVNHNMTVFGGASAYCGTEGANFNDTWLLSNADGSGTPVWTNTIPNGAAGSPSIRRGQTAVYDQGHDRMIIYGGDSENCSSDKLGDVWVLTNATGAQGTPSWEALPVGRIEPPPRSDHGAIYDSVHNIMVIAGGTGVGGPLNDVWVLRNANGLGSAPRWIQLHPTGGPPPQGAMRATVYDSVNNRMTVFGGWNCCAAPLSNQAWVLIGANGLTGSSQWIQLAPSGTGPPPIVGPTAIYDPLANHMLVFGGDTETDPPAGQVNTVWVLTNSSGLAGTPQWNQISIAGPQPAPRGGTGDTQNTIAGNIVTNAVTIFGGYTASGMMNDTWVLSVAP